MMHLLILTFVVLIRRRSLLIGPSSSTTSSRTALVAVNLKCDGIVLSFLSFLLLLLVIFIVFVHGGSLVVFFFFFFLASVRYFKENGWPSSTIFEKAPEDDEDRAKLIDILQAHLFNFLTYIDTVVILM